MEEKGTGQEGDQYVATPHHRYDGDHGVRKGEGIEVNPVRDTQEYGDKDDVPSPLEWRTVFTVGIPQPEKDDQHDGTLVHIEPDLNRHHVHTAHQVFIIEATQCPGQDRYYREEYPFVMGEMNPLLLSRRG